MVKLGYCKEHGVVDAVYESFLGTWHCSKCFNYVDKASDKQIAESYDLVHRSMI